MSIDSLYSVSYSCSVQVLLQRVVSHSEMKTKAVESRLESLQGEFARLQNTENQHRQQATAVRLSRIRIARNYTDLLSCSSRQRWKLRSRNPRSLAKVHDVWKMSWLEPGKLPRRMLSARRQNLVQAPCRIGKRNWRVKSPISWSVLSIIVFHLLLTAS